MIIQKFRAEVSPSEERFELIDNTLFKRRRCSWTSGACWRTLPCQSVYVTPGSRVKKINNAKSSRGILLFPRVFLLSRVLWILVVMETEHLDDFLKQGLFIKSNWG